MQNTKDTARGSLPAVKRGLLAFSRFVYMVGIQSIRILKRFSRRCVRFLRPLFRFLKRLYRATLGKQIEKIRKEFASVRHGFSIAWDRIRKARARGALRAAGESLLVTGRGLVRHKKIVGLLFNIAAPVAALFFLVQTVQYWNSLEYGLTLSYGDQTIATIRDEQVFDQAMEMVTERMVHDTASENDSTISLTPVFALKVMNSSQYTEATDVCDLLIRQSNGIIEEATGLYMDGELIGAVRSSADLNHMLSTILEEAVGDDTECEASFLQDVEMVTGLFPSSTVISADEMKQFLTANETEEVSYTVKDGDTPITIAQEHGLTLDELNALNGGNVEQLMFAGTKLTLQREVPRLSVQITKTETYEEEIPFETVTKKDDTQYTDYSKVTQQGKNGLQKKVDKVTYVNGTETKRENVSSTVLEEPTDKVIVTGTKKRPLYTGPGESSGKFQWPVPSLKVITTNFEYRWGSFHPALDISGYSAYGKSIVAADGGTVVASGWGNGYGNRIIIDHGNGYRTLYAHCSELLVPTGTKVSKGQLIARVGSTGNSTGPHLHFEVILNGVKQNPLHYVSP